MKCSKGGLKLPDRPSFSWEPSLSPMVWEIWAKIVVASVHHRGRQMRKFLSGEGVTCRHLAEIFALGNYWLV